MNRRFSLFLIIEAIILFFLLAALFRRGFIILLVFALLLSWIANRLDSCLVKIIAGVVWVIALVQILTSGSFWLAILFPIAIAYFYYKRHEKQEQPDKTSEAERLSDDENGNEVIDLDDLHYHTGGNNLSIRKANGNVKILVPADVGIALQIRVRRGLVRIFNEQTEINDVSTRYFSTDYESAEKRISINIVVDAGNVEVLHK